MSDIMITMEKEDVRRMIAEAALTMYANEPCRICRRLLTMDDLHDGAKFAGYSEDGLSRAAHRICWENFVELVRALPPESLQEMVNGATE